MSVAAHRARSIESMVHLVSAPGDWADAGVLLRDYVQWMRVAAGFDPLAVQPALAVELADIEAHYSSPDASLFIARIDDVAVGTVAARLHPDSTAELKRMYVRPDARSRGVADALVAAVLDMAAAHDRRMVWLETKRGAMDRAIAVYRRHGFVEAVGSSRTLDFDGVVVMEHRTIASGDPDGDSRAES